MAASMIPPRCLLSIFIIVVIYIQIVKFIVKHYPQILGYPDIVGYTLYSSYRAVLTGSITVLSGLVAVFMSKLRVYWILC